MVPRSPRFENQPKLWNKSVLVIQARADRIELGPRPLGIDADADVEAPSPHGLRAALEQRPHVVFAGLVQVPAVGLEHDAVGTDAARLRHDLDVTLVSAP